MSVSFSVSKSPFRAQTRWSPDSLDLLLDKKPLAAACLAFYFLCFLDPRSLNMCCSLRSAANFRSLQRRLCMVFALTCE